MELTYEQKRERINTRLKLLRESIPSYPFTDEEKAILMKRFTRKNRAAHIEEMRKILDEEKQYLASAGEVLPALEPQNATPQ